MESGLKMKSGLKMESRKPDRDMADSDDWQIQEGVADPHGKVQAGKRAGRIVQSRIVAIRALSQTSSASNTPQRTTADHAVAECAAESFLKTGKTGKSRRNFEIEACKYNPKAEVRQAVKDALKTLQQEWELNERDSWLFALSGVNAMYYVMEKSGLDNLDDCESDDYQFVALQLGPYYADTLTVALELLNELADAGYSWEYYNDFCFVTKYFDLQPDQGDYKSTNRQLMLKFCTESLDNELSYLQYIKGFPVRCSVLKFVARKNVADNIKLLSDFKLPSDSSTFLDKNKRDEIKRTQQQLLRSIKLRRNNDGTIDEAIGRLENDVTDGTSDVRVRRLYGDLLSKMVAEQLKWISTTTAESVKQHILVLKEMKKLYDKSVPVIEQFRYLFERLRLPITTVINKMVLVSSRNLGPWKKEWLDFIDDLVACGLLGKGCITYYFRCREMQLALRAELEPTDKTEKITRGKYKEKMDEINLLMEREELDADLKAAEILKQLLYKHGKTIRKNDQEDAYMSSMDDLRSRLHKRLFVTLSAAHFALEKKEDMNADQINAAMSQYIPEYVRRIPYIFVVPDAKKREYLARDACAVWFGDLSRLSSATSFRKKDIDLLLDLKRIAPDMPNSDARTFLKAALVQIFTFILQNPEKADDEIPDEKVAVLAQWVDDLNHIKDVRDDLKELKEAWKKTARSTMASAASDHVSGIAIPPESGQSSIAASKSSTPTAKAPAARASRTVVIFPRGWEGIERDTSLQFLQEDQVGAD